MQNLPIIFPDFRLLSAKNMNKLPKSLLEAPIFRKLWWMFGLLSFNRTIANFSEAIALNVKKVLEESGFITVKICSVESKSEKIIEFTSPYANQTSHYARIKADGQVQLLFSDLNHVIAFSEGLGKALESLKNNGFIEENVKIFISFQSRMRWSEVDLNFIRIAGAIKVAMVAYNPAISPDVKFNSCSDIIFGLSIRDDSAVREFPITVRVKKGEIGFIVRRPDDAYSLHMGMRAIMKSLGEINCDLQVKVLARIDNADPIEITLIQAYVLYSLQERIVGKWGWKLGNKFITIPGHGLAMEFKRISLPRKLEETLFAVASPFNFGLSFFSESPHALKAIEISGIKSIFRQVEWFCSFSYHVIFNHFNPRIIQLSNNNLYFAMRVMSTLESLNFKFDHHLNDADKGFGAGGWVMRFGMEGREIDIVVGTAEDAKRFGTHNFVRVFVPKSAVVGLTGILSNAYKALGNIYNGLIVEFFSVDGGKMSKINFS